MTSFVIRCGILVVACAAIAWLSWEVPPPEKITEPGVVMDLPDRIGNLTGEPQPVSESEIALLPKDTEFAKMLYTDPEGDSINCQIVLAGADKRSIHRPEICLRGQGWSLQSGYILPIELKSGRPLDVMVLTIDRPIEAGGEQRQLTSYYLYWFVSKSTETAKHIERIAYSNLDLLLHNRTNRWAYVIVSAPVLEGFKPNGKNREETLAMLKEFIAKLAPQIMKSEQSPPQA